MHGKPHSEISKLKTFMEVFNALSGQDKNDVEEKNFINQLARTGNSLRKRQGLLSKRPCKTDRYPKKTRLLRQNLAKRPIFRGQSVECFLYCAERVLKIMSKWRF